MWKIFVVPGELLRRCGPVLNRCRGPGNIDERVGMRLPHGLAYVLAKKISAGEER